MKILKEDYGNKKFVFLIENDNDLWDLYLMINRDDLVTGLATRKITINSSNNVKKIKFTTTIKVEKTEFKGNQLKILGKTVVENEYVPKGAYQSINVEIKDKITIIKEVIDPFFKGKINEVKKPKYKFLIALFDRNEWLFAEASNYEIREINHVKLPSFKRIELDENFYERFTNELKNIIRNRNKKYDGIVVGSPGIFKNKLQQILKENNIKAVVGTVSSISKNGIKELLLSNEIKEEMIKLKISEDLDKINKLLERIAKENKIAYGLKEVENAALSGAIDELLISEKLIIESKNKESFEDILNIMRTVENLRGKVSIISKEVSQQLDALGGIAAFLRFEI